MRLDVDITVRRGDFTLDAQLQVDRGPVALVGANGSGKSTLLRALAGAVHPDHGHIRLDGETLFDASTWVPPEERGVGYQPQGYGLFQHMTALDNVAYGPRMRGLPNAMERAQQLLDELGVGRASRLRPRVLSGGQLQRVSLARALANDPRLLLLDEPTNALDVAVRPAIRELLTTYLCDPSRLSVIVTHDRRDLQAWKPIVVLMDAGRVSAVGAVDDLRGHDHPLLRELLG